MATKNEEKAIQDLTKEVRILNSKLDRLIRIQSLSLCNGIATEDECEALFNFNDKFEDSLKQHAIAAAREKKKLLAEQNSDKEEKSNE